MSIIHNTLKQKQPNVHQLMNKYKVVYPYNGMLLIHKKE